MAQNSISPFIKTPRSIIRKGETTSVVQTSSGNESGWTAYFEDCFIENTSNVSISLSSSVASDTAWGGKTNNSDVAASVSAGSPHLLQILRPSKKALKFCSKQGFVDEEDQDLVDTATSPVSSPLKKWIPPSICVVYIL